MAPVGLAFTLLRPRAMQRAINPPSMGRLQRGLEGYWRSTAAKAAQLRAMRHLFVPSAREMQLSARRSEISIWATNASK